MIEKVLYKTNTVLNKFPKNIFLRKTGRLCEENQKNEKNLFTILKSKIFLENYILKSEFLATDINKYNFYKKYNENIRGCRIEAKVEKVFEEGNIAKMEVAFF